MIVHQCATYSARPHSLRAPPSLWARGHTGSSASTAPVVAQTASRTVAGFAAFAAVPAPQTTACHHTGSQRQRHQLDQAGSFPRGARAAHKGAAASASHHKRSPWKMCKPRARFLSLSRTPCCRPSSPRPLSPPAAPRSRSPLQTAPMVRPPSMRMAHATLLHQGQHFGPTAATRVKAMCACAMSTGYAAARAIPPSVVP